MKIVFACIAHRLAAFADSAKASKCSGRQRIFLFWFNRNNKNEWMLLSKQRGVWIYCENKSFENTLHGKQMCFMELLKIKYPERRLTKDGDICYCLGFSCDYQINSGVEKEYDAQLLSLFVNCISEKRQRKMTNASS